mmetsp:Transcript_101284/g.158214  ORF Transcript_101284/g.158214 Transcript_101284/m.158214 type:complete len:562 (+) Transcript_101284:44-1729(+)
MAAVEPLLPARQASPAKHRVAEVMDEDSSSSSSSSDSDKEARDSSVGQQVQKSRDDGTAPTNHWTIAKKVLHTAKVGVNMNRHLKEIRAHKAKMAKVYMILVVFLSVAETETKAAAFHMSAVGKYSIDGEAYQFKYSMFVTLGVFIMKLCLAPAHSFFHKKKQHKHKHDEKSGDADSEAKKSWFALVAPWFFLVIPTLLNVASVSLANFGLTLTPTSIFVVCKTTKIIFVALMSVLILKTALKPAQWASMVVLSFGLLLAVFGDKGAKDKSSSFSLLGPILLIASEVLHATMLIAQQIAVRDYWPDTMKYVSWSAAVGIPATLSSMLAASNSHQSTPPYEPVNDFGDVFVMCWNNPTLGVALSSNLIFHVLMDVSHMVCLRYMSSLARSLADAIKLAVMWLAGKVFWFLGKALWQTAFPANGGTIAVLAEPPSPMWYLMIPSLLLIAHSMLMFKYGTYFPLQIERDEDGNRHLVINTDKADDDFTGETGIDDTFYADHFKNKRVGKLLRNVWKKRKSPEDRDQQILDMRKEATMASSASGRVAAKWKLGAALVASNQESGR